MRRKFLIVIVAIVMAVVFQSFAIAQSRDEEKKDNEIMIEGRILRPQASYILQRANVDFGLGAKKRSFIDKIEVSIDEPPFK